MSVASVDNIIIDNNFLSPTDLQDLLVHTKNIQLANELLPNGEGCDYYDDGKPVRVKARTLNIFSGDASIVLNKLIASIRSVIEFKYGQRLVCDQWVSARMWSKDDYQSPHSDSEFNNSELCLDIDDSNPNWDLNIPRFLADYSSLVYLNDDYEGGELVFPEYGLEIKPKAGDVVTFPTNAMYIHAVNKINSGTRYNVVLKWFRKTTLISNTMPKNTAVKNLLETL